MDFYKQRIRRRLSEHLYDFLEIHTEAALKEADSKRSYRSFKDRCRSIFVAPKNIAAIPELERPHTAPDMDTIDQSFSPVTIISTCVLHDIFTQAAALTVGKTPADFVEHVPLGFPYFNLRSMELNRPQHWFIQRLMDQPLSLSEYIPQNYDEIELFIAHTAKFMFYFFTYSKFIQAH